MPTRYIPTIFVIFGATGDLMAKKITPALYHLWEKGKLPKLFKVIGVSRRDYSDEDFQSSLREQLLGHKDAKIDRTKMTEFLKVFQYHQGDFNTYEDYIELAKTLGLIDGEWKVCANKLFYLAVPPQYYKGIFQNLHESGSTTPCSPEEGWTRILVEKPFGNNAQSAEELDLLLGKLFKEEQIYRIDHYLAKEMLQNIITFRFANNVFEQGWNNKYIEKIELKFFEKLGVEERGAFYDGVGAIRDVGQNHLLQMLALATMDHPGLFTTEQIRKRRAQLLQSLRIMKSDEVKKKTFRAQYDGYRKIKGVKPDSNTETYFRIETEIDSPRWQGIPVIMEAGKRMKDTKKEIVVTYKHTSPCLCPPGLKSHIKNKVTFVVDPDEEIKINFLSKKPGLMELDTEERSFDFYYRDYEDRIQFVEEYEKLLLDCIEGNQLLFTSTDEIKATWKFVDAITDVWEKNSTPLSTYKPDSESIVEAASKFFEHNDVTHIRNKEVAVVGLGKMGANISKNMRDHGWRVVGWNRTAEVTKEIATQGIEPAYTIDEMLEKTQSPRIIWMMLPAGKAIDDMLFGEHQLIKKLSKGDIVVDAANSFYADSVKRAEKIKDTGVVYVDIGVSGGPEGARNGACLMVGGEEKTFTYLLPLLSDIAVPDGVAFFEGRGGGHFVKMVHNGIEYGMMQAIAEGYNVLKKSDYKFDLPKVTDIYNHGSVVESRLIGWLNRAFEIYGPELKGVSGRVSSSGEGAWTVNVAKELGLKTSVIEAALQFRVESEKNPDFAGQVVSAMRNQFGGHKVGEKDFKTVK